MYNNMIIKIYFLKYFCLKIQKNKNVTIQPPLNTYDSRPRKGQTFVEMHGIDINSRPRRGPGFVSRSFSTNMRYRRSSVAKSISRRLDSYTKIN